MPVKYRIDKLAGIVYTEARGEVTDAEVLENQREMNDDPDFNPRYRELCDFSAVQLFAITPQGLRMLASSSLWGDGARRAFVAQADLAFGMLRMHQSLLAGKSEGVSVFRTQSEAWRWLEESMREHGG